MRHSKPAVRFIFITLLLDVLGFGLLIPISPKLVEELGGGGISSAATSVGLLASLYAAMQFIFSPVLGSLSDRFGRRPILLIALFGSGVDYFAMALAPSLTWLFITRAINGISGASMTVATAYVADTVHRPSDRSARADGSKTRAVETALTQGSSRSAPVPAPAPSDAKESASDEMRRRAAAFGMLGAAFGVGFAFGPLIGGALGEINIRLPFYVAGALTLVNWLYGAFVLPESLPADRRRPVSWSRTNPIGVFASLRRYPLAAGLIGVMFLINIAQFGLHATWVLYTGLRYQWSSWQVGSSLAVVGVSALVIQGGLARRIIPRLGEPRSVLIGLTIAVGAYLAYGFANHGWMIYAIIALASIGGIAGPAIQSLITRSVDPREQGEVQGANTGLASIAGVIGYSLGANLFAYFITDRAPLYLPGASFFMSALLSFLGLLLAAAVLKKHSRESVAARDVPLGPAEPVLVTNEPAAAAGEPG